MGEKTKGKKKGKFIIIGCGTTGCMLADTVAEVLKGEKNKLPKKVEFVFIDSDESSKKDGDQDQVHWEHLSRSPPVLAKIDWLPDTIKNTAGPGVGRVRMFGKALYSIHKKDEILKHITNYMVATDSRIPGPGDWIFIILNTLSGGTGSSFFLDLALDIRNMVRTQRKPPPIIFGIGVLPKDDEAYQERANALASLKELHFMLSRGGGDFLNPFTSYFIVGRQNIGLPIEELPECIARFVADVLLGEDPATGDLADIIAGLLASSKHRFSTLGYNEVRFPADMLSCYYNIDDYIGGEESDKDEIPNIVKEIKLLEDKIVERKKDLDDKRKELEWLNSDIQDLTVKIGEFRERKTITSRRHKKDLEDAEKTIKDISDKASNLSVDINGLTKKLRQLGGDKDSLEKKKQQLEVMKQRIKDKLNKPTSGVANNIRTIELDDDDIDTLKMPGIMTEPMYNLIKKLGKDKEEYYNSLTRVSVETGDLVFEPLLDNYNFSTSQNLDNSVLDYMLHYNFLTQNPDTGEIMNDEEKLRGLFECISTDRANYGDGPLTPGVPSIVVPGNVRISNPPNPARLHSFAVYLLEAGLQPWALSEDQDPRLKELQWLTTGYNQAIQEKDLLIRHSLFYDNPRAFSSLTGRSLSTHAIKRCEEIVKYWQGYEIIDDDAKVSRVAVSIAKAMSFIDKFSEEIENINVTLKPSDKITKVALNTLIRHLTESRVRLDRLLSEESKLTKIIKTVSSVNESFENSISQLSSIHVAIDKQKVNNLSNMISDCRTKLDSLTTSIQDKIADLRNIFTELEGLESRYEEESPSDEKIEKLISDSVIPNIENLEKVVEKLKMEIEKPITMEDGSQGPLEEIKDKINRLIVYVKGIPTH